MKWIILFLFSAAQTRNAQITNDANFADKTTTQYCAIKTHPFRQQYAIPVVAGYEKYFTASELASAVELDSTWYQTGITQAQYTADSIATAKKNATTATLTNLYKTNVVGTDVRNLTATQQKITLGVVLMKLEMVDTNFKMK